MSAHHCPHCGRRYCLRGNRRPPRRLHPPDRPGNWNPYARGVITIDHLAEIASMIAWADARLAGRGKGAA